MTSRSLTWLVASVWVLAGPARAATSRAPAATPAAPTQAPTTSESSAAEVTPAPSATAPPHSASAEAPRSETVEPRDRDRDRAAALFREGTKFYELGQYPPAIDRFERAWELAPEPQLLYNLGQAHWKWFDVDPDIDHLRKARTFFVNYDKRLRTSEGYSPTEVDGFVRALNAQIEAEDQKLAERNRPVVMGPSLAERDAAERRRLERARQLRVAKGMRASGITLLVLGSASLAMGLGGIIGRQTNRLLLDTTSGGEAGSTNLATLDEDQRRRRGYLVGGQLAFSGFILGGVLLPLGITLEVLGTVREKRLLGSSDARVSLGASGVTGVF